MSSRQLVEYGDIHCWYAGMQLWFESHDISINALPMFQYSLDCPHLNMMEKNRVIQTDTINLESKITLISPKISLGTKMAHYKTHIRGWIHHQAILYGHTSILFTMQCDWAAINFITSIKRLRYWTTS